MKSNPRSFWRYAGLRDGTTGIPSTMRLGDVTVDAGTDIVNLFAQHFNSTLNDNTNDTDYVNRHVSPGYDFNVANHSLDTFVFSRDDVLKELCSLKDTLSSGPDGLPVVFVKNLAHELCVPLTLLFNLSLTTGQFPYEWKKTFVTPVYKKGDRDLIVNYRQIAKISIFAKIYDKLVTRNLSLYLLRFIKLCQHGFTPRRSTTSNLIEFNEYIVENLLGGYQVDCIYTDLRSAFDSVNFVILCQKLKCYGVCDNLVNWIMSFLSGRCLMVKCNNFISSSYSPSSGVPQGSSCGPLLFIIYINDLISSVRFSKCLLFADDLKIFLSIRHPDDAIKLQSDLNALYSSFKNDDLFFNISKCHMISFHKDNYLNHEYSLNNVALDRVTQMCDLGVIFDENLTFEPHINYIVNASLKRLHYIFRIAKDFRDIESLCTLYNSLVKSLLVYASPVWSPNYNVQLDRLQSVQHRFMRNMSYKMGIGMKYCDHDYSNIAKRLCMFTFRSLFSQIDVTCLYKIIYEFIDSPKLLSTIQFKSHTRDLRTHRPFADPVQSSNFSNKSFIHRACGFVNASPTVSAALETKLVKFTDISKKSLLVLDS